MEFCDKESLLLFSLSSSRCLWAIDLIVTTIICRQWFQLKWFLAMIWLWLLFDYYHPKSSKSRFAQCFQWFSRNSAKQDVFGKNRTTLENTAFYQLMPENSDSVGRTFESCRAYQNAVKSYDFTAFLYRIVQIICFYCVAQPDRAFRKIAQISKLLCIIWLAAFLFLSKAWV